MKPIIIALCFFLTSSLVYGQGAVLKVQHAQKLTWKTYQDKEKQVSIKYPSTWDQKQHKDAVFLFMRPYEEPGQKFKESVNLAIGDADDLYLVEYVMDALRKMPDVMPNFKPIVGEYVKLGGLDAYRMKYQFTNSGLLLTNVVYIIVNERKAYNLTFAAIDKTFDKYYPMFETMAKSFRINKPGVTKTSKPTKSTPPQKQP